ncbi:hypothetical protein DICSQDRAFT_144217 [Dichomitus squalens LYAD-421 SS1]|uniref:uncharacterized protein n=1 Tax=Dichomitus squalens (strain LYAD-421) TaxID=732165 RepID=UPI0004413041|nr:uncharacterized protein DICSQDRAFT_144217 [Dichomitus squalens LYAD-421 SS1]EJF65592.1 hypothetical protein DICSQDRAFT_144217 [Dichomitus squalens LYAD-421 SS1]
MQLLTLSIALLSFDYLITFDREICYLSGHKRSWVMVVFLLNRYISLFQSLVTLLSTLLPVTTFSCIYMTRTIDACQILLYVVWAVFSALRVYAFSGNNAIAVVVVVVLSLVPVVTYTALSAYTWIEVDPLWPSSNINYCNEGYSITPQVFANLGLLKNVPLLLLEAIVIVVTFVRTWNLAHSRDKSSMVELARLVLKEGIIYFLAILLINSTQSISDLLLDLSVNFVAASAMFPLMVPVLVSRFYLDLDDIRRAEDARKAEANRRADLERAKLWRIKPLPPLPKSECGENISYIKEVFQYNRRLWGKNAILI